MPGITHRILTTLTPELEAAPPRMRLSAQIGMQVGMESGIFAVIFLGTAALNMGYGIDPNNDWYTERSPLYNTAILFLLGRLMAYASLLSTDTLIPREETGEETGADINESNSKLYTFSFMALLTCTKEFGLLDPQYFLTGLLLSISFGFGFSGCISDIKEQINSTELEILRATPTEPGIDNNIGVAQPGFHQRPGQQPETEAPPPYAATR